MRNTLILAAMLAATPFLAHADELSYTYAEAGWTQAQLNSDDLDDPKANGGYLRGSYNIAKNVNVFGSYSTASKSYKFDGYRLKVDLTQPELGIGYHMNMTDRVDFTADAAWVRLTAEAKLSGYGESDRAKDSINLGRVTAGIRGKPSPRTEAWVKVGVMDGSDIDTEFVGTLGGQIKFNKTWGLVGDIQFLDDLNQYSVGVRASF